MLNRLAPKNHLKTTQQAFPALCEHRFVYHMIFSELLYYMRFLNNHFPSQSHEQEISRSRWFLQIALIFRAISACRASSQTHTYIHTKYAHMYIHSSSV